MPPPPMPRIALPANMPAMLLQAEQTTLPTVNMDTTVKYIALRPNISASDAIGGWKTAAVRRYELTIQNALVALTSRAFDRF